ncbi:hypothetical protein PHLCEN_2v11399 [Hermanssonia centrifuga]|uniref:TM7S3/TM198-like domain-containing protein n=1 Tax=Hermanssonia centrifuga TaxID=98765 RepID=A0A2R6NJZ4_9APHY|nr:hypothetical protein PHLCEN_2v11399 [Hermanssonia centrifuga]
MPASASHHSPPFLLALSILALAVTISASPLSLARTSDYPQLARRSAVITYDDSGHIQNITDSATQQPIAQGDATDGSGAGFDVSALIWLASSFAVGVPLMLAGIRLWRITTGAGLGLAITVCIWAAFNNTVGADSISDFVLTLISVGSFVLGFFLGVFDVGRIAGMTMLGFLGGFSIGIRIVLFRSDLLIHTFFVNWLIITVLGIVGFLLVIAKQRAAITICSAAVGTFLTGLGIDLVINKQSGMSFGLRYLFDGNSAHLNYFMSRGWHPPLVTEIIMAVSLALIPLLAYAQHRIFKQPFKRVRTSSVSSLSSIASSAAPSHETAVQADPPSPSKESYLDAVERKPAVVVVVPESAEETPIGSFVDLNSLHDHAREDMAPSPTSAAGLLTPKKPS